VRLAKFAAWCRELGQISFSPVSDCVHAVLEHSGLVEHYAGKTDTDLNAEDRIENLEAFVARAVEFEANYPEADLPAFLEDVSLVADIDAWDTAADCLSLMTLHSAKGLEFDSVFVVGVEDGLLPHQNSDTPAQVEEERRLLYVGITRARKDVALTHAASRFMWHSSGWRCPSVFLSELPEDAVERVDLQGGVPQRHGHRRGRSRPGRWG
jgi:DNA helicase-2/ATP-dependent DNA helicase PcrA